MCDFGFEKLIEEENYIEEDNFNIEESLEKAPISKRGNIFKLGRHTLMCGDSTSEKDCKKLVQGGVMLLLTDPPYNIDYEGKTEKKLKIENDSMNNEEFVIFLEKAFKNAVEVMNKGASFYIWHAETTRQHFIKAMENLQLKISEVLIWNNDSKYCDAIIRRWEEYTGEKAEKING